MSSELALAAGVAAMAFRGHVLAQRGDPLAGNNLAIDVTAAYVSSMAKVSRNQSSGRFTLSGNGKDARTTIRDASSGKVLDLKGYGALSGQYAVRKGFDLSKPIAAQAAKTKKKTIAPPKQA